MFKRIALLVASTLATASVVILPSALPAEARHGNCVGSISQNGALPQGDVLPTPDGNVTLTATFTGHGPGFTPDECDIGWVTSCAISLNGTPLQTTCTASPGDTTACSVVTCTVTATAVGRPTVGDNTASASLGMKWGCCLWRGGPESTSTMTWTFDWLSACEDGLDNDSDGRTDHPNDPGCSSPDDTSEATDCGETAPGVTVCVTPGTVAYTEAVRSQELLPGDDHSVVGYLNAYEFTFPGFGQTILPCVVLVTDGQSTDPCAEAGGEYLETRLTFVEQGAEEPDPTTGPDLARVSICHADYKALVAGFGVSSFAGYAVC